MKNLLLCFALLSIAVSGFGQAVTQAIAQESSTQSVETMPTAGCGGYHFLQHLDKQSPGYLEQSNQIIEQIAQITAAQDVAAHKKADLITIPVVFHVMYNNDDENLPDSVIMNQLKVLQQAFRHTHADTGALRDEFKSLAGDAEIEFVMADKDPDGNATNGIVRQSTSITHFGGVLPYNQNQTSEIQKWVADSFYHNIFRMTKTEQGGSDEWDPYTYLNIWIGDMRILEPKLNDFEELLFVALATPPRWHEFWPEDLVIPGIRSKGVLIHYVAVGANNPVDYPAPYGALNDNVKQGKIAIHEVGHYLGLRHIWGDVADCEVDDYIDDTPPCLTQSNFRCLMTKNTCVDNSQGSDLPDMIENYMDYSSGNCAVAFTKGQIAVMREVYDKYRKEPSSTPETHEVAKLQLVELYPNPNNGQFFISTQQNTPTQIVIEDLNGRVIYQNTISVSQSLYLNEPSGIYVLRASNEEGVQLQRIVIE